MEAIEVNANPVKEQVATGIRYILYGSAMVATALGFTHQADQLNHLLSAAGPLASFGLFVWGQFTTRRNAKIKRALAEQLPDTVAKVK